MNRRTWLAAGLVTAAAVAVVTVPAQAAPPANAPGTGVTLVTGDMVTVLGGEARVTPARGREKMPFRQHTDERGNLHVVPADVQHLISTKEIDPRLFDVTELVRSGYDDAHGDTIPLIIQGGVTTHGGKRCPASVPRR